MTDKACINNTLKSCPFCGSKADIRNVFHKWRAGCINIGKCEANPQIAAETYDGAVKIWNTRYD